MLRKKAAFDQWMKGKRETEFNSIITSCSTKPSLVICNETHLKDDPNYNWKTGDEGRIFA